MKTLLGRDYTLLVAKDGIEAYNLFRDMGGAVDLVVTDIFMPRMNGTELAQKLRSEKPSLSILFMSGLPGRSPGTEHCIRKPFTRGELKVDPGRTSKNFQIEYWVGSAT